MISVQHGVGITGSNGLAERSSPISTTLNIAGLDTTSLDLGRAVVQGPRRVGKSGLTLCELLLDRVAWMGNNMPTGNQQGSEKSG